MRKLVYYSVYDKDYCDLLKISLESLSNNIDNKTDILVIYNLDDSIYIKNLGINYVRFLITDCKNKNEGAINRYKVFLYHDVGIYDLFLYIDADTLILKDLNIIFEEFKIPNIYTNQGYLSELDHPNYTIDLSPEEIFKIKSEKRQGINSGIFGFSRDKIEFFKNLIDFIKSHKYQNLDLLDQPYFGTFLLRNNPDYLTIGDPLGTPVSSRVLINNEAAINTNSLETVVILHFAGNIGNGNKKIEIIKNYRLNS